MSITDKYQVANIREYFGNVYNNEEWLVNIMGGTVIETESERLIKLGKAQAIIEIGQEDGLDDVTILKRLQEKIIGLPLNRAESYLEEYRKKSI